MFTKRRFKTNRSGGNRLKVALIGNQNSGKTTLFNCLTGMNAKIGNWPGVTIDRKTGLIKGSQHEITDLPGIYSLSPYSAEEEISRRFIFEEKPDIIINIIDATSIERSLYLTTQLLELDCQILVVLNMVDMLEKKGLSIDVKKLEQLLGIKILRVSALKEKGIEELIKEIHLLDFQKQSNSMKKSTPIKLGEKKILKNTSEKQQIENDLHLDFQARYSDRKRCKIFDPKIESTIGGIEFLLEKQMMHKRFIAVKLLEEDKRFCGYRTAEIQKIKNELARSYDTDLEEIIATQRYHWIEKIKEKCVVQKEIKQTVSDQIDKFLLNQWIAFPIFALIMFCVYYVSVGVVGNATIDLASQMVESFGESTLLFLEKMQVTKAICSLIVDGIIFGVGAVLGFIPQLAILFFCISMLEATGYMPRIALLLDKVFRKIGLSGKSLIPFIVGSGCSVPGILGTKILENEEERKMATVLTPFIPCSAKLPMMALFCGYFFGENSGVVSASLYFLAIAIIIVSAYLMKKFIWKEAISTYISELPEYKIPSIKYVGKDVLEKVIAFIKRAGSVIFICSIIIWFLVSFSLKLEYGVEIERSILAVIGKKISWIFYPILGVNSWGATVSAIQGLVAKEQVISSMSVIAGIAENEVSANQIFTSGIFRFFTKSSAYAFMVFNLFSAPCFGAIAAMKKELGSVKRVLKAVTFQTVLAWILATIVYQLGSRIENGSISLSTMIVVLLLLIIFAIVALSPQKLKERECRNCPYCHSCEK